MRQTIYIYTHVHYQDTLTLNFVKQSINISSFAPSGMHLFSLASSYTALFFAHFHASTPARVHSSNMSGKTHARERESSRPTSPSATITSSRRRQGPTHPPDQQSDRQSIHSARSRDSGNSSVDTWDSSVAVPARMSMGQILRRPGESSSSSRLSEGSSQRHGAPGRTTSPLQQVQRTDNSGRHRRSRGSITSIDQAIAEDAATAHQYLEHSSVLSATSPSIEELLIEEPPENLGPDAGRSTPPTSLLTEAIRRDRAEAQARRDYFERTQMQAHIERQNHERPEQQRRMEEEVRYGNSSPPASLLIEIPNPPRHQSSSSSLFTRFVDFARGRNRSRSRSQNRPESGHAPRAPTPAPALSRGNNSSGPRATDTPLWRMIGGRRGPRRGN